MKPELIDLIEVGSIWICEDEEQDNLLMVDSIDPGTSYPILYHWKESGTLGRDTVAGFIDAFRPIQSASEFLAAVIAKAKP